MHRTGVSSAGSTEDLIPDFISVKNPKDLGRNEPLLAFQRDYHSLQMKLNNSLIALILIVILVLVRIQFGEGTESSGTIQNV